MADLPLFDSCNPCSKVAWEGYNGDHYIVKTGMISYIPGPWPSGRPHSVNGSEVGVKTGGAYLTAVFFYVEKEGFWWYIWPAYVRFPGVGDHNDVYIYFKWPNRNMNNNDIEGVEIEGWRIKPDSVSSNPVSVSVSVTAGNVGVSLSLIDVSGQDSELYNTIDNGWLKLGHGWGWKHSYAPWNWMEPWYMRGYAKLSFDGDYLRGYVYGYALVKAVIRVTWGLHLDDVPLEMYVDNQFILGDNIDSPRGSDGYIQILPGSSSVP